MSDKKGLLFKIRQYYINSESLKKADKQEAESAIDTLNKYLNFEDNDCEAEEAEELFALFKETYTDRGSDIAKTFAQSRFDESGLSATHGYKEIYFNEIVQNANDNTNYDFLNVVADKTENNDYTLDFSYADLGFKVENIVGLFNMEMHSKRRDLSATGKHGVGIKSLFYFVDSMEIRSNIIARFQITTCEEDGQEKIENININLERNKDWDRKCTHLKIDFKKKKRNGFNVEKLCDLIDLFKSNSELQFSCIKKYFIGEDNNDELNKLVFDIRSLIFTDKNKGKDIGIKNINFFIKDNSGYKDIFSLHSLLSKQPINVPKDGEKYKYNLEKNKLIFKNGGKEESILQYYVITVEDQSSKEQNFSVAWEYCLKSYNNGYVRFYETYYIPNPESYIKSGINIGLKMLVNSKYSSTDRTKLSDDNTKITKITEDILGKLRLAFEFIVSEGCNDKLYQDWRGEISNLFHYCIFYSNSFVNFCCDYGISNRYLVKYKDSSEDNEKRYIVYSREKPEAYERPAIVQKIDIEKIKDFFKKNIIGDDAIEYSEDNTSRFIDSVCLVYKKAFICHWNDDDSKKKFFTVINAFGAVKDLLLMRIKGNGNTEIYAKDINSWLEKEQYDEESQKIAISIIAKYKLYRGAHVDGTISSDSFYEYLFSDGLNDSYFVGINDEYRRLKDILLQFLVNKDNSGTAIMYNYKWNYDKGEVAFFYSKNGNVIYKDAYYDENEFKRNNVELDSYYFDLFFKQIKAEDKMFEHIITEEGNSDKLFLTDPDFPVGYWLTNNPEHNYNMRTSGWHLHQIINISFLKNIVTDSLEKFEEYITFFKDNGKMDWFGEHSFNINQKYKDDCLQEIKRIFYSHSLWDYTDKISLIVDGLDSSTSTNLCPRDYFEYIKNITDDKEIYLMQVEDDQLERENKKILYKIVFIFKNKIKIRIGAKDWKEIGEVKNNTSNKVIIVTNCAKGLDWKKAICLVIEEIYKSDNNIVAKCEAFIPEQQKLECSGEVFDRITDREYDGNPRAITKPSISLSDDEKDGLSMEQLKYIIKARGNNDGKCCCCGINIDKGDLVIVSNSWENTKDSIKNIINVTCNQCKETLNRCHQKSYVKWCENNKSYYVEHICLKQNQRQRKEVTLRYRVPDGVVALWK